MNYDARNHELINYRYTFCIIFTWKYWLSKAQSFNGVHEYFCHWWDATLISLIKWKVCPTYKWHFEFLVSSLCSTFSGHLILHWSDDANNISFCTKCSSHFTRSSVNIYIHILVWPYHCPLCGHSSYLLNVALNYSSRFTGEIIKPV
jgi:hypothetical protein